MAKEKEIIGRQIIIERDERGGGGIQKRIVFWEPTSKPDEIEIVREFKNAETGYWEDWDTVRITRKDFEFIKKAFKGEGEPIYSMRER